MTSENNPYKQTIPDYAYTDKNRGRPEKDWERVENAWPRCYVCDVPMGRGYVYVNSEGRHVENKFGDDNFCSIRCLKRRLNGLADDDEKAMNALLRRVELAENEAKHDREMTQAHEDNLVLIRAALKTVLATAPGLAKGTVAPPGGLLARQVAALQSAVDQRVTVKERYSA